MNELAERIWNDLKQNTGIGGVPGNSEFRDIKELSWQLDTTSDQHVIHDAAVLVDRRVREMKAAQKAGDLPRVLALFSAPIVSAE